jgi:ProP effector
MPTISPQPHDLIAVLADLWPQAFALYQWRRRPLKIGIDKDIAAAAAGAITATELKIALRSYCSNIAYLSTCKEGADRVDLDGAPAGHVTAEQAARAAQFLTYKRSKPARRDHVRDQQPLESQENSNEAAPDNLGAAAIQLTNAPPRRLSIADLRAAAAARRQREAQP